ncbi:DNA-binding transcriptional regulator, MocR family, contains an aminotransferase domain [Variovorax sp. HW608]|uniref:aminotransferase-like domain-containing protein n=1 Tax=Variovorax sp. HW608 TaxID=1034889 RepID=UPI00081FB53B|nr:PLP-dependent aminotransferase family protein [Variovorax sp. HW608]SCK61027.1 DNA-binding transcriptional regulator, MocR family, contains an aminotransferase domain [Variovorax sp. HW608]
MLTRTSSQSLTGQLADRFAERIRNRLLAPGARLPSVRECARQQGVSPHTVVAAYDQLLAQGLVEARRQKGFFVRDAATVNGGAAAMSMSFVTQPAPAPVVAADASTLIRGMFHRPSDKPQPGMGVFPPDWLESTFMPAALRRVTGTKALQEFSLQYGEPAGDSGLRRSLSAKLARINVPAAPDQIVTTVGATHALDIVSRTLLRPGDPVMVEEPGWALEFARLEALGMRILPVPRNADGPDLEVMERYCNAGEGHRPKLFVSVSVLHNPTGYSLSPGSAHRVLQLANKYDFHIVEDDTYSHLAPEHATRLSSLDGLRRTVYVSGFAKILAPNWRIGFLAASPALVGRFLETKLIATLTTPSLFERALAWCIDQGQLRRHAERIRLRLDGARGRTVKLALHAGCKLAAEPAGLFGWVDTGVDTDALTQRMLDEGYLIAPGSLFHARRPPTTLMRINFATAQDATFWRVFARVRDQL